MGTLCSLKDSKAAKIVADMLANAVSESPAGQGKEFVGNSILNQDGSVVNVHVYKPITMNDGSIQQGPNVLEFYLAAYTWPLLFSFGTYVTPGYRGFGLADVMQEAKDIIARDIGYTTLICTVNPDNTKELALMVKYNWKMIGEVDSTYIKAYGKDATPSNIRRAGIWIREVSKLPMEEEIPRPKRKRRRASYQ